MDIIKYPDAFFEFAGPLAGATFLIIVLESLYNKLEKRQAKKRRKDA